MSRRPSLDEIRHELVIELDEKWRTPSYFSDQLGLGHGIDYLKTALVLERLAADEQAELQRQGRVRRCRRMP
jgi:hypothetical protein